jgi:hypothetical protein
MIEIMKWNVVGAVGRTEVAWNPILELLLFITLSPKGALAQKNLLMRKQKTHTTVAGESWRGKWIAKVNYYTVLPCLYQSA